MPGPFSVVSHVGASSHGFAKRQCGKILNVASKAVWRQELESESCIILKVCLKIQHN